MLLRFAARVRSWWQGMRHRNALEAGMKDEFALHLDLRTADLMRQGLTKQQAEKQARIEFGPITNHMIDARAARGLAPVERVRFSSLDFRLGVRMLVKYPGLSIVAITGMATAITIGVGAFSLIASLTETHLPLPDGQRIVALRNDMLARPGRSRATLNDFMTWRGQLESVEHVSAFVSVGKNLIVPGSQVEIVRVARMTASGFAVAATSPILGRTLLEEDERQDARVVVVAFREWQHRFGGDSLVVGKSIRLGADAYTIVGVMPEGFGFPVDERYWTPLHFSPTERSNPDAISLTIFGKLTEDATLAAAQAEVATIGARLASTQRDTHEHLRPRVLPFSRAFFDIDGPEVLWSLYLFRFFLSLILVVVAVNVAILVYARTATRAGEIAVRTALGASRTRVLFQLFIEALVLSGTAAMLGLAIAGVGLEKLEEYARLAMIERRIGVMPFWIDLGLSPAVVTYALVLAIVSAVIVGVVPGLHATGKRVQNNLQRFAGHGARMQLGKAWTTMIVMQVAVAVTVLPFATHFTEEAIADSSGNVGYASHEFLEATLNAERVSTEVDTSAATRLVMQHRFAAGAREFIGRIQQEPGVTGVSFRTIRSHQRIQIEEPANATASRVINAGATSVEHVSANLLRLHDMPLLAGRHFDGNDSREGSNVIIVNHEFVLDRFDGKLATGRHVRFVRDDDASGTVEYGPWLEIVGVVNDFAELAHEPQDRIYRPVDVAMLTAPVHVAARLQTSPAVAFAPRLRAIATSVDPELQLETVMTADERYRQGRLMSRYLAIGTTVAMLCAFLLSAAGIYAMMSFTVIRRRREIGIRTALGAGSRHVITSIFARASAQIAAGIMLGTTGTFLLDRVTGRGPVNDGNAIMLPLVAAMMAVVGLLAAIGPARQGLAVQPNEALREE